MTPFSSRNNISHFCHSSVLSVGALIYLLEMSLNEFCKLVLPDQAANTYQSQLQFCAMYEMCRSCYLWGLPMHSHVQGLQPMSFEEGISTEHCTNNISFYLIVKELICVIQFHYCNRSESI